MRYEVLSANLASSSCIYACKVMPKCKRKTQGNYAASVLAWDRNLIGVFSIDRCMLIMMQSLMLTILEFMSEAIQIEFLCLRW